MPSFIIKMLIDLAISWGIPAFLEWAAKALPWFPKKVLDIIVAAAAAFLEQIKPVNADTSTTPAEKTAKARAIKRKCVGVACAADTKGLD